MNWLWTWGGKFFGYRRNDALFTHSGKEVGRFHGDDIFGRNGRYLGEIRSGRLIRKRAGKSVIHGSFSPRRGGSYAKYVDYVGYVMVSGYEDFPSPESLA